MMALSKKHLSKGITNFHAMCLWERQLAKSEKWHLHLEFNFPCWWLFSFHFNVEKKNQVMVQFSSAVPGSLSRFNRKGRVIISVCWERYKGVKCWNRFSNLSAHLFAKTTIFLKPLTVWVTINCGKFWKGWAYQTTWPASWETYMQVRKQQLELDMEQQTGSK